MTILSHPIRIGELECDIPLDRSGSSPVYRQIAQALKAWIISGQIPAGTRLPPERRLAALVGVNRSTIVTAYNELASEGLISGRVGDGTVVAHRLEAPAAAGRPFLWHQLFAEGSGDLSPWIREILRSALRDDVIAFAASEPSPALFPMREVEALALSIFQEVHGEALRYAPTEGIQDLREVIAERLRKRGANVSAAHILITAGAQQALDLLARCFLEPGSDVAIESPTYVGAIQAFRNRSARLIGIPVDASGMRSDALDQILSRRPVKFVFAIPNFSNPTGGVLSEERRQRILEITRRHQVPLIEDNVYGDTWFDTPPPPSLIERTGAGHVIHVGSLSKAMFAGLRVGWIAAPEPVIERLGLVKQIVDLFGGNLSQRLAVKLFQSGLYDRHVETVRPIYRKRREALIEALERHAPGGIVPNRPEGGSFLWCRLSGEINSRDLLSQAALQGVTFVPGDVFSVEGREQSSLRMGFSLQDEETIEEGVRRLSFAFEAVRRVHGTQSPIMAPPLV